MADASDIEFLRRLIAETSSQPRAQLPGALSLIANHPGILTSEIKSQQQYDQDMRRKYFLEKASEHYPNAAAAPPEISQQILKYRRGEMDDLGTPYEYQGVYQGRSPTAKGFQWWASLPAITYHAAKMSANAITPDMYPDAGKDMLKAANTFSFGALEDVGVAPRGTGTIADDYADEKDARGRIPWQQLDTDNDFYNLANIRQSEVDKSIPSGGQYLRSVGADIPGVDVLGGVMDSMLDPFGGTFATLRAARTGGPAMRMFLSDNLIGAGIPAVAEGPRIYEQVDRMIDRLHGVR